MEVDVVSKSAKRHEQSTIKEQKSRVLPSDFKAQLTSAELRANSAKLSQGQPSSAGSIPKSADLSRVIYRLSRPQPSDFQAEPTSAELRSSAK